LNPQAVLSFVPRMKSLSNTLRLAINWQARLINWNPIVGAAYLLIVTFLFVFWLPVQVHNVARLSIAVSIPAMLVLHIIHLFAIFQKLRF